MPQPRKPDLILLRAAQAPQPTGDGAARALPGRFVILPWGRHETNKGTVIVDERTLAVFDANQARIKRPTVKGDFQHESCRPDVKHPITFAVESGRPRVIPGEGIVIEGAKWTAAGLEHVPTDYGDISAAPYRDKDGVVIALHSFALCDHGEVNGVTIAPVSLGADLALLFADPAFPPTDPPATSMSYLKLLITLLARHGQTLAEDATPEQIETALTAALADPAAAPAAPDTFSATLNLLQAQVTELRADQVKSTLMLDIQRQMDAATLAGKLVPLSADDLVLLGADRTKALLDKLPPDVVPLSQRTPVALSAGQPVAPAMNADTAMALRDLGHDPATAGKA
ncbi:MAG: phage protease [Verrucomicrobiota bacterium]